MAQLEPLETYPVAEAASMVGLSEEFLLTLIAKGVKLGVIKAQPGYTIRECDLSRLAKVFYNQVEAEQHRQAYLRVRARDEAELQERLERGKQHE